MKNTIWARYLPVLFMGLYSIVCVSADERKPVDYSEFGYYRIASISPKFYVGQPKKNGDTIWEEAMAATTKGASVVLFPELSVTGYTAEDMFLNEGFLKDVRSALSTLVSRSKGTHSTLIVGAPYRTMDGRLYNVAFVISDGAVIGAVPKTHLPNYGEFYERRWFTPGGEIETDVNDPILGKFHLGTRQLFRLDEMVFAIEICEDVWAAFPPSTLHALAGANVIFNPSGSNELVGKLPYRKNLLSQQSARLMTGYVYSSSGPMESTKDLVFGGDLRVYENGDLLAEGKRFQMDGDRIFADIDVQKLMHERQRNMTFGNEKAPTTYLIHDLHAHQPIRKLERKYAASPFVPEDLGERNAASEEIMSIQSVSLARKALESHAENLVIGISGGQDSTLAFLVAAEACKLLNWPTSRIVTVTMPGGGTTKKTKASALRLMEIIGSTPLEINITQAVEQHFKDIGHPANQYDLTYENSQARERTQILFDIAIKYKGLVVGTGNLTELCLGWCTYNADHMSGHNPNVSLPKTLVSHMISWYANTRATPELKKELEAIAGYAISPELLPTTANGGTTQTTEASVGPNRLHDFFIYHYLRNGFSPEKIYWLAVPAFKGEYSTLEIKKWLGVFLKRFYSQQFKRDVLPSGPKVGSVSVSPRGDLRMPPNVDCAELLSRVEAL